MKKAILVCFTTQTKKFSTTYERNKFFRRLYGWKQTIRKNKKNYEYKRKGLLDNIPHIRVDQSMFIVMEKHLHILQEFFKEWDDKINWKKFQVLLDNEQIKLFNECGVNE